MKKLVLLWATQKFMCFVDYFIFCDIETSAGQIGRKMKQREKICRITKYSTMKIFKSKIMVRALVRMYGRKGGLYEMDMLAKSQINHQQKPIISIYIRIWMAFQVHIKTLLNYYKDPKKQKAPNRDDITIPIMHWWHFHAKIFFNVSLKILLLFGWQTILSNSKIHCHKHRAEHYLILIWNYYHYLWLWCVGNPIKMNCNTFITRMNINMNMNRKCSMFNVHTWV